MARVEMLMVFSYDIADDRRRRRVARILEETMVRVPGSVFETRLSERATELIVARVEREMGPATACASIVRLWFRFERCREDEPA